METKKRDKQTQTHNGPGKGDENGEGHIADSPITPEITPEQLQKHFKDARTTRMETWEAPELVKDKKKPRTNGK